MIQLKWFRVEHLKDGSLGGVTEVDNKGKNNSIVRYYEAVSAKEACNEACRWYANHTRTSEASKRNTYLRRKEKGLCVYCTVPPKKARKGKTSCEECGKYQSEKQMSYYRGETQPRKVANPEELLARRKARAQAAVDSGKQLVGYGAAYARCLERFDTLGPKNFRKWLVEEIQKRKERQQLFAKEREVA